SHRLRVGVRPLESSRLDVLVILASLRAEGTPRMALSLCERWLARGLRPAIVDLGRGAPELEPQFRQLSVPLHRLPIGSSGYGRYAELTRGIFRLCREYRPSGVLCMPFGLLSFAAMGARAAGVRHVCAHVGNPPDPTSMSRGQLAKFRAIVRLGRPFTQRLLCCSHYVRNRTLQVLGVAPDETRVVYNGANLEQFDEARRRLLTSQRPSRALTVGMVATLESHKDQDTLIHAAAQLSKRGVELRVRLIGDGSQRARLEALVEKLSAPVDFLGSCADVPDRMAELDVFVFSTTDREGLGIALIEAMAAGVPVIASDVPACREVLDGGKYGLLVPAQDSAALADAIEKLGSDLDAASQMAEAARGRALREFSSQAMADSYLDALAIDRPPPVRSVAAPAA
ncbi:MAG TPA: glycosyltransferase, partial [Polyangiaceae bacterium]